MINQMTINTVSTVARMANKLWEDASFEELSADFENILSKTNEVCFIYVDSQEHPVGFIHISTRYDYVEGSSNSPVGYIEGIYVEEEFRRQGISRDLVKAAEEWSKLNGYTELASDCELENEKSIVFHKGLQFEEANRIVCFIKEL